MRVTIPSMTEPHSHPARRALSLATEGARRAGLDAAGAKVVRVRTSIHVELPRADVVARRRKSPATGSNEYR